MENVGPGMGQGAIASWYRAGVLASIARTHARVGHVDRALARFPQILPAIERAPGWAENCTRTICDAAETLWLTDRTEHIQTIDARPATPRHRSRSQDPPAPPTRARRRELSGLITLANVPISGHREDVKGIKFHPQALEFIREQTSDIRRKIGEGLREIQKGMVLGMPKSRPMPDVAPGVAELRVKDANITARVFYITKVAELIIVFHGFEKDTSKTPRREIELGRKRLKEILDDKV